MSARDGHAGALGWPLVFSAPGLFLACDLVLLRDVGPIPRAASLLAFLGLMAACAPLSSIGTTASQRIGRAERDDDPNAVSELFDSALLLCLTIGFAGWFVLYNLTEFALPRLLPPGSATQSGQTLLELRSFGVPLLAGLFPIRALVAATGRTSYVVIGHTCFFLVFMLSGWALGTGVGGLPPLGAKGAAAAPAVAAAVTLGLMSSLLILDGEVRARFRLFRFENVRRRLLWMFTRRSAGRTLAWAMLIGLAFLQLDRRTGGAVEPLGRAACAAAAGLMLIGIGFGCRRASSGRPRGLAAVLAAVAALCATAMMIGAPAIVGALGFADDQLMEAASALRGGMTLGCVGLGLSCFAPTKKVDPAPGP